MKNLFLVYSLLTCLIISCGKDKGLSDEESSRIRNISNSMKSVGNSVDSKSRNSSAMAAVGFISKAATASGRAAVDPKIQQQLAKKLQDGNCNIVIDKGATSSASSLVSVSADVTGPTCPVTMHLHGSVSSGESNAESTIFMTYVSHDEEFTRLSQLRSMDLKGTTLVNSSVTKLTLTGDLDSTLYGKVGLYMKVDLNMHAHSGLVEAKFTYPDMTTSLKFWGDGNSAHYEINGEEVDEDEAKASLEALK